MEPTATVEARLDTAVRASLAWYEDVFSVHGIPTRCEDGLWSTLGDPPRWHSVAKTLDPHVLVARVLAAAEPFESCSVADSYATLDLAGEGFQQLFRATWLYRPATLSPATPWPDGWSVVSGEDELVAWNTAQDTTGVLLPALLRQPRFTFLVRRSSGQMVAGGVLHRVQDAVELSNTWALGDDTAEILSMLGCADTLHPKVPVVGYCADQTLRSHLDAGFDGVAPHVVWVRQR